MSFRRDNIAVGWSDPAGSLKERLPIGVSVGPRGWDRPPRLQGGRRRCFLPMRSRPSSTTWLRIQRQRRGIPPGAARRHRPPTAGWHATSVAVRTPPPRHPLRGALRLVENRDLARRASPETQSSSVEHGPTESALLGPCGRPVADAGGSGGASRSAAQADAAHLGMPVVVPRRPRGCSWKAQEEAVGGGVGVGGRRWCAGRGSRWRIVPGSRPW